MKDAAVKATLRKHTTHAHQIMQMTATPRAGVPTDFAAALSKKTRKNADLDRTPIVINTV